MTARVMHSALLFCWQFAGKQTCWLHFCYIVFTGSHAEREIELRLFGMLLYSRSSAFGRLPELLQRSAGELENSMRRGWVGGTLFYVYQADFMWVFFFFCKGSFRRMSWFYGKLRHFVFWNESTTIILLRVHVKLVLICIGKSPCPVLI